MTQQIEVEEESFNEESSLFPLGALSVSREEIYSTPLKLKIQVLNSKKVDKHQINPFSQKFLLDDYWDQYDPGINKGLGPLPEELEGHVFVIGSAGSFDSEIVNTGSDVRLPTGNGIQSSFAGDGIAYRIDFHNTFINKKSDLNVDTESTTSVEIKGWASLQSRIPKTPDFYVDQALEREGNPYQEWKEYESSRFRDTALTRVSFSLGGRNLLNTAWLPFSTNNGQDQRLLVTWDAGRPYEINPRTLELVAPVGLCKEWKPMFELNRISRVVRRIPGLSRIFPILGQVFPLIVSSAHPVFDKNDEVVYGVNVTRSLNTIFQIGRSYNRLKKRCEKIFMNPSDCENYVIKSVASFRKVFFLLAFDIIIFLLNIFLKISELIGFGGRDHLYLYSWKGNETSIGKDNVWEVLGENGRPIKINQTPHQLALTEDFIIISDSSFKIVLGDLISSIFSPEQFKDSAKAVLTSLNDISDSFDSFASSVGVSSSHSSGIPELLSFSENPQKFIQLLSSFLNYPQYSYTDFYLVPRPDRMNKDGYFKSLFSNKNIFRGNKVLAKHFRISPETAHFTADYKVVDNKLVIHAGHIVDTDPAEFIHGSDEAVCGIDINTKEPTKCRIEITDKLRKRAGSLVNGLGENRIGTWIIDLDKNLSNGVFVEEDINFPLNSTNMPFLGFLTHDKTNEDSITDIFWSCGGKWNYRLTLDLFEIYKDQINADDIARFNKPESASILHVKRSNNLEYTKLNIVDHYEFPKGFFGTSPQYIPAKRNNESYSNGYIIALVLATDSLETGTKVNPKFCEFWIFSSDNLSKGPMYRLSHPKMNIGSTLHTTWLKEIFNPPDREDYDIQADYQAMLDRIEPESYQFKVKQLFNDEVFNHY